MVSEFICMAVCQLNAIFPLLNLDHSMCQGSCACFCLGEEMSWMLSMYSLTCPRLFRVFCIHLFSPSVATWGEFFVVFICRVSTRLFKLFLVFMLRCLLLLLWGMLICPICEQCKQCKHHFYMCLVFSVTQLLPIFCGIPQLPCLSTHSLSVVVSLFAFCLCFCQ